MTQGNSLYNTGGVPDFIEPGSEAEARQRIAELSLAIASINDQISYYEAAGALDATWFRKAATSRRYKVFERERLEHWLKLHTDVSECIVAVVQGDYSESDWEQVMVEAKKMLASKVVVG